MGMQGDVTFHWASGKITEAHVGGRELGLGACPPGGLGHDTWAVGGQILKGHNPKDHGTSQHGCVRAEGRLDLAARDARTVLNRPVRGGHSRRHYRHKACISQLQFRVEGSCGPEDGQRTAAARLGRLG